MDVKNFKKSIDHFFFALDKKKSTYYISSQVLLRGIGFLYFCVFYPLVFQLPGLLGQKGILPIANLALKKSEAFGSVFSLFIKVPSLFWFFNSDTFLLLVVYLGLFLSILVLIGFANSIIMFALWFLQLSLVHVGQDFWSYGWEYTLLELGFLGIFLCPLLSFDQSSVSYSSSRILNILFKWVLFRFVLGAGLIKLRTDSCWTDLSCLYYHFETQPIPNTLSSIFHFAPKILLKIGVLISHIVQIIVPFFIFFSGIISTYAGLILLLMQIIILLSGNYAWLNYLTIVMIIPCFDDRFFNKFFTFDMGKIHSRSVSLKEKKILYSLFFLIVILSIRPVKNLLSSKQVMNTTYDRLHLVNSYGVFGFIGKKRYELIIEGTNDNLLHRDIEWKEYDIPCKPGAPRKKPCWSSPYHYRLAWQLWIASFDSIENNPWLISFVARLLEDSPTVNKLLKTNPFPLKPPKYIRIKKYEYKMVDFFANTHKWYTREYVSEYLSPVSLETPLLRRLRE